MTDEGKKYHRIRHYPGRYSGFDLIEECIKPKPCVGCQYDHALCTENGRVLEPEKYREELERERSRYGRGA